jgi:hypothetical protein
VALVLLGGCLGSFASGEEPISFVMPAANFQPVAADAYPDDTTPTLTVPTPSSAEIVSPEGTDADGYVPADSYEPLDCPTCNGPNCHGGGSGGCNCLPPPLPNGQYPDDWMWGCGQWPYANGPGTCDDWKVGPIWDVTVDGMVMTREHADLGAIAARAIATDPNMMLPPIEVMEQFDRGPGGRVYLTGLLPKNVGYQMFAGYEGIEEWNAAVVFEKEGDIPPPPPTNLPPAERRSVYYRSSLHSGELNFMRMCNPAWRPYCGVRYIKFDDEITDLTDQIASPPVPMPTLETVTTTDTLNLFDIENNLIGFQGGVKYDIWQLGRRFSLQGFFNGGAYYNKAKRSNLMQLTTTQITADDITPPMDPMAPIIDETSTSVSTAGNLNIIEESNVAFMGEASLTAVCRLNKCWACRAGYQVLYIDGLHLAEDAYLDTGVGERSLIFHGWHAGVECRR